MDASLPKAKSASSPDTRAKLKRIIAARGLCGLANDTKWTEFISAIRDRKDWRPRYRLKCVDGAPSSSWDRDWFYHLPYPLLAVEWLDIRFLQEKREHRLPPRVSVIDHSSWLEELLRHVGMEYQKGTTMIRISGTVPKARSYLMREELLCVPSPLLTPVKHSATTFS